MLPDGVKPETISAHYENGTLTIRIPVPDVSVTGSQRHQIPIRMSERTGI
jgi:HSP20 family molecular chaperone IbpA